MGNSSNYPLYVVAVVGGAAIALWAGMSPFLLIVLACPLMMFFMMRGGMSGGQSQQDSSRRGQPGSTSSRPADLDGSHERIDRL
ncbi:DUF2933 domain-containing protein [Nocardioides sp.]|uniref:DUF2933 domain-containing protein n=1 Tax=Nocardioides sp. TaxID=35761 RepID=UPI00286C201E|nr:DUF2933 domain-containing protein [Nocardioides sp.]